MFDEVSPESAPGPIYCQRESQAGQAVVRPQIEVGSILCCPSPPVVSPLVKGGEPRGRGLEGSAVGVGAGGSWWARIGVRAGWLRK